MDHEGGPVAAEDRELVTPEREPVGRHPRLHAAVGPHHEVRQVARVGPVRIPEPVAAPFRIEVAAGRLESRRVAARVLVDMEGVLARGQVPDLERDLQPDWVGTPRSRSPPRRGRSS